MNDTAFFLDERPQPEAERIASALRLLRGSDVRRQLDYLVGRLAGQGQVTAAEIRAELLKKAATARKNRRIAVRAHTRRVSC